MAKYDNIIENLTAEQKVELALKAEALADEKYAETEIPQVSFAAAEDDRYPSYKAMANCWNKNLMQKAWQNIANEKSRSADVLTSPVMGVCNSPYSAGAVEDPYLAGSYIAAFTNGVKQAGLTAAVTCNFESADVAFMDAAPDERAFCEYYMRPYKYAAEGSAICFPYVKYGGAYGDIYTKQTNAFVHSFCNKSAVLCKDVPEKLLDSCIKEENIVLDGNVKAAGAVFPVQAERSEGVVDPAMRKLDAAVNRAVDFAFNVKSQKDKGEITDGDKLPISIAEESCVLLKNNGALPMKQGAAVAVTGGLSADVNAQKLAELLAADSFKTEWKEGYSFKKDIAPELTTAGVNICSRADYCVVFLGFDNKSGEYGRKHRRTKLPASQLALLDGIVSKRKKIIAVVGSDYPVDLSFGDSVAAILLCPSSGQYTAKAVANILAGKISPSGRLARSWYADTDRQLNLIKNDCRAGNRKIGVFAGYRGAAEDQKNIYPFGFGLSYSSFEYSNLQIEGNNIKFNVKNNGGDAAEVIQIYTGKPESVIVRPERELKAVIKVDLKAGETKNINIKIVPETLSVYTSGKFYTEGGKYNVYVGSSSRDIKLKGTIDVGGINISGDGKKLSDYKVSETNVLEGGHTLSPVNAASKNGGKLLTAGLSVLTAALILAALFVILYIDNYIDFTDADMWSVLAAGVLAVVIFVALILILSGVRVIMKSKKNGKTGSTGKGASGGKSVQSSFEELFSDLYGYEEEDYLPEESEEEEEETVNNVSAETPEDEETPSEEYVGKFNAKVTFADTCRALSAFSDYKGLSLGFAGARKIMAAMAASRIIVLEGNSPLNGKLEEVLGEYFGSGVYRTDMNEINGAAELAAEGTPFAKAIEDARENPDGIYMAVLENAVEQKVTGSFSPFIRCAYENGRRRVLAGAGKVDVPPNIWFVIVPDPDAGVDYQNRELCNGAAVLVPDLAPADKTREAETEKLTYSQFVGMLDRITRYDESGEFVLDEDHCWKKIDKLEKYLNGKCGYSLDNRECLSIERYAAVYLACDSEQNDALDSVVACKLILPLMALLKNTELEDGEINSKIESIFDECGDIKKVINSYGLLN